MNEDYKQGVVSLIDFPLGQDERAVSMAIQQLLKEGWEWVAVSKTHIRLRRMWEVDVQGSEQSPINTEGER
jgi:hypothetical protein